MVTHFLNFKKAAIALMCIACLSMGQKIEAQTLIQPSNASVIFDAYTHPQLGMTTAMMLTTSGNQLCGYASYGYNGLTNNAYFNVFDADYGTPGSPGVDIMKQTLPGNPTGTPSIMLANYNNVSTTNYIAAIAYPESGDVRVEFYEMTDNGSTLNLTSSLPIYGVTYLCTPGTVHLAVLPEYDTPYHGQPFCSRFILVFDDISTNKVYSAYGDMSQVLASTWTISPTFIDYGAAPDVAGIQRAGGSGNDYIGLMTYTDASGHTLYYNEYDITAPSVGTAITLDAVSGGSSITVPRIAANPDFNTNVISYGNAYYKVVAQVDSFVSPTDYYLVRTYDNVTYAASNFWTSSDIIDLLPAGGFWGTGLPISYNHYSPTVAFCGPAPSGYTGIDGTEFMVQNFTHDYGEAKDVVMMVPINDSFSYAPDYYYNSYLYPHYPYYWVSDGASSSVTRSAGGNYTNGVSSACNSVGYNSFSAWAYPDGLGGYNVRYKTAPYIYAYRQASPVSTNLTTGWQVYPNPTNNYLTIDNPAGASALASFTITDVLGQTVLNGSLAPGSNGIYLSLLKPGLYSLQTHRDDGAGYSALIIKQ